MLGSTCSPCCTKWYCYDYVSSGCAGCGSAALTLTPQITWTASQQCDGFLLINDSFGAVVPSPLIWDGVPPPGHRLARITYPVGTAFGGNTPYTFVSNAPTSLSMTGAHCIFSGPPGGSSQIIIGGFQQTLVSRPDEGLVPIGSTNFGATGRPVYIVVGMQLQCTKRGFRLSLTELGWRANASGTFGVASSAIDTRFLDGPAATAPRNYVAALPPAAAVDLQTWTPATSGAVRAGCVPAGTISVPLIKWAVGSTNQISRQTVGSVSIAVS